MNGDRLVRWTAVASVLAVAAVAALISYRHAVQVVTAHGEPGITGRLYPAAIDGLIVAASLVLLDAARHREDPPALAWWMLGAGIAATLAANVLAGVPSGWLGAIAAAWPAAAFVGCYELLMLLVRASARRASAAAQGAGETALSAAADAGPAGEHQGDEHPAAATVPAVVPADAEHAALLALRATLAAGNALSGRQLETRFGLTRSQSARVRKAALAESNGHQGAGPGDSAGPADQ